MKSLLFFLLCSLPLFPSSPSWYGEKLQGWYYFEEALSQEKKDLKPTTPEEAIHFAKIEKKRLKALLALALMDPTEENIRNYLQRQKKWIDQSVIFSQAWTKSLMAHPLLGDHLENPTSSYGIKIRKAMEKAKKTAFLKKASDNHFLLFFFKGKEVFSQKAGEMLSLFAEEYGWQIKALSLDEEAISSFPQFECDQGMSQLIGVEVTPSFFAIDPQKNKIYPVGAGLLSLSQLEDLLFSQISKEEPSSCP